MVNSCANAGGARQRIFGLVGWSGAGKTTLMEKLLGLYTAQGLTVSTIKHAHHGFDLDKPGKDSYRHREAGATEVLVASATRWALMHENRAAGEPSLEDLLSRMQPVDLLLIEGFKAHPHPKLEVFRPILGQVALWPGDKTVCAVASDQPIDATIPVFELNDAGTIASFILEQTGIHLPTGR